MELIVKAASKQPVKLEIKQWNDQMAVWTIGSSDKYDVLLTGLTPHAANLFSYNNTSESNQTVRADIDGRLVFINIIVNDPTTFSLKKAN